MPLSVTHKFVSLKANGSDPTIIQPSNWNETHVITGSNDVYAADFNFDVQTPQTTLVAGILSTITLSPVPAGVNGQDSGHYLRITGTGGSSETVLIVGGTAVAGSGSGTLIFTPANNHTSGTWNIGSATSGIAEAQQYVITTYGKGVVKITNGVWPITGSIRYQPNMIFRGQGPATVLSVTSNIAVFDGNVPIKSNDEYTLASDNVCFSDFTISGSTGLNTIAGIRGITLVGSTECWSYFNITIERINFNNIFFAVFFHRVRNLNVIDCSLWANSTITVTDSSLSNSVIYHSVNVIIQRLNYIWHYMVADGTQATMTSSVFTAISAESVKITDSFFSMRGSLTNTGAAIAISFIGGEDLIVHDCTFINVWSAIALGGFTSGGVTYWPGFVTLSDCSVDQIWGPAIWCNDGTSTAVARQVGHIQIIGNELTDMISTQAPANFILVGQYTKQVVISDNVFRNQYGSVNQVGVVIAANATEISFGANIWDNETGDVAGTVGIALNASAGRVYGLDRNLFNASVFGTTISDGAVPVASAAALAVPSGRKFVPVSGTTTITSITYNGQIGDSVTLLFTGALQVTKGSNLKLNSNFVSTGTATGSLTLYWDGTNMIEVSRSAN